MKLNISQQHAHLLFALGIFSLVSVGIVLFFTQYAERQKILSQQETPPEDQLIEMFSKEMDGETEGYQVHLESLGQWTQEVEPTEFGVKLLYPPDWHLVKKPDQKYTMYFSNVEIYEPSQLNDSSFWLTVSEESSVDFYEKKTERELRRKKEDAQKWLQDSQLATHKDVDIIFETNTEGTYLSTYIDHGSVVRTYSMLALERTTIENYLDELAAVIIVNEFSRE